MFYLTLSHYEWFDPWLGKMREDNNIFLLFFQTSVAILSRMFMYMNLFNIRLFRTQSLIIDTTFLTMVMVCQTNTTNTNMLTKEQTHEQHPNKQTNDAFSATSR